MKKNALIIIALLACSIFTAQSQVKFGLKAGVNISKMSFDKDAIDSDNLTGFQVGPMVEFTVPIVGLGFDAGVLYSQRGFKSDGEKNKLHTIDIPVNLKYKLNLVAAGIYFTAGPYASFNVGDDLKDQYKEKSFGAGLNFGMGVELLSKLQIGANYQLGLTEDVSTAGLNAETVKSAGKVRGWTVSAAYFF